MYLTYKHPSRCLINEFYIIINKERVALFILDDIVHI